MNEIVLIDSDIQALLINGQEQPVLRIVTVVNGRRLNIHVPVEAVANRKAVYGLATDEEALTAILNEHATREYGLGPVTPPEGEPWRNPLDEKMARMGGLRTDVTIRQGTEADLPPLPPVVDPNAELRAAIQGASTIAELKAALLGTNIDAVVATRQKGQQ